MQRRALRQSMSQKVTYSLLNNKTDHFKNSYLYSRFKYCFDPYEYFYPAVIRQLFSVETPNYNNIRGNFSLHLWQYVARLSQKLQDCWKWINQNSLPVSSGITPNQVAIEAKHHIMEKIVQYKNPTNGTNQTMLTMSWSETCYSSDAWSSKRLSGKENNRLLHKKKPNIRYSQHICGHVSQTNCFQKECNNFQGYL